MVRRMRPQPFPDALVAALCREVAVQFAEGGREAVRIAQREELAAGIADLDQVPEHLGPVVETRLEDAAAPMPRRNAPAEVRDDGDRFGVGTVCPHHDPVAVGMDAEDGMGISVGERDEPIDLLFDLVGASGASHRSVSEKRSRAGMRTQSGR